MRWWEDGWKMEKLAARQGAGVPLVGRGSRAAGGCTSSSATPDWVSHGPTSHGWGGEGAGLTSHVGQVHLQLIQQHAAVRLEGHHLRDRQRGRWG